MKKNFFVLTIIFTPAILLSQDDVSVNATRPSASDNAYLTAPGYTEIEIGGLVMDDFWTIPTLLKFGLHRNVELGFTLSGLLNHTEFNGQSETEVGDPGGQIKVQLTEQHWGAVALVGRADFPEEVDPKYTVSSVLSYQTRPVQWDMTLGGSFFDPGDGEYDRSFLYAVAASPKLTGHVGAFIEVFGEVASEFNPVSVDFGLSDNRWPEFVPDVAVAIGLTDDAPDWQVQFGFTASLIRLFE